MGTFPIAEVSNGHTFFVQKMHEIVGVPPVAVHCTYQYGDDTGYAYGKRQVRHPSCHAPFTTPHTLIAPHNLTMLPPYVHPLPATLLTPSPCYTPHPLTLLHSSPPHLGTAAAA